MRAQLLVSMIALTVIPVIILQVFYTNYLIDHVRENRIELVHDYADSMAQQMMKEDYFNGNVSSVIDGEVKQFSSLYDGRIIVTDANCTVLMDTYGMMTSKKLVSSEVVRALKGEALSEYNEEADQVWMTYVARDSSDNIQGMLLFFLSCGDLTRTYDAIVHTMTMVLLALGAILIVLSYIMTRRFMRPFKDMESSIKRISNGKFDEGLQIRGFSEVEGIAEAYDTMLSRLKELEDSRQEFVSNVSHELKTPLTSMKVLADSLNMQQDVPNELYREFMVDIASEIDRENTIITDLLTLVKMDKTSAELNISKINLNELTDSIVKRLRPIAAKRNIELVIENCSTVIADCDEVKMTSAISNLVENAIKYNMAGGWVQVSLDADDKYFYINVADSGVGIPEDVQDKIFERFYRVDKARSRETGGTGLGLAITKDIITKHNGQIKVSSKMDHGTTFSVRIPLVYTRA